MKEETIKNRIEKYKNGETSLEEDKFLFDEVDENQLEMKLLSDFVKENKVKIPANLNDRLWKSFDEKTAKKNRFKIGFFSAAASIVLVLSLFLYNNTQNKLSETEKAALLEEARNMFEDTPKEKEVYTKILENELVIVYTKTSVEN